MPDDGQVADSYSIRRGSSPLLVSIPHSGLLVPRDVDDVETRLTDVGRSLIDTDWYVDRLYDFVVDLDASVLIANYSRYVVDLNRARDGTALYPGQSETEICPTSTFTDEPLYVAGENPGPAEISRRITRFWQPYHDELKSELERIRRNFGYAMLWDAHSIQSQLPRFFDGILPELNLGTADGAASTSDLGDAVYSIIRESRYSSAYNGRFKGGYITRNYGNPDERIFALQLEIAQRSYMSEYPDFAFDEGPAEKLRSILRRLLQKVLSFRPDSVRTDSARRISQ